LPRPPRNSSYASNSISKYSNHDLKNNPIGNIKNETVYNNNFLNDKYNDSNIYPKYKKGTLYIICIYIYIHIKIKI